jgi:ergothioneine biosynthesis protein EgtB
MKSGPTGADDFVERFLRVRAATEALAAPLSPEDCVAQSMPDASPAKWHLGHTSWFFETSVLARAPGYEPFRAGYSLIFNSYYDAVGARHPRPIRGLLTRPSLDEVRAYRSFVTGRVVALLTRPDASPELRSIVELGVNHEEQHQELLLTDIKHLFASNPLHPCYRDATPDKAPRGAPPPLGFRHFDAALRTIGHGASSFCFDNETPAHREFVEAHALGDRSITNAEYLEFVRDRGYTRPELWLSDGFRVATERNWTAPLYWEPSLDGAFTLAGVLPLNPADPVCHVSFYEADAFARWSGARLPTEAEWEAAAHDAAVTGNFVESGHLEPRPASEVGPAPHRPTAHPPLQQLFGDVWEWTQSAYLPYPGFRPLAGALGEYNGKFMSNQMVLRGGSCATPRDHVRATYRNFFPPDARWQFTGIRLARSS